MRPGTASPPAARRSRRLGLRAARARRRDGAAGRESGLLRDRDAARARAAEGRDRPGSVVVDGLSGMTGAGRTLKAASHAGAVLENVAPYRVGAHQHVPGDRPAARLPRLVHAASAAAPTRVDRDLQRPLHRPRPARAARGGICRQRRRDGAARRDGAGARAGPAHRPGRDRGLQRPLHRSHDRHLRRGQPRQGRRRAGDPERESRARARGHRRAATRRGARSSMSVTAAQGFVASGVTAGIRPSGRPDLAVVRSVPRAVGAALWTTNRVQAAPVTVSRRHLALAEPQAVLINAGVRECGDRRAGRGRRRRDGRRRSRTRSGSRRRRSSCSRPG